MNESYTLLLDLSAGCALGAFFFGGLYWTVRHGSVSRHPALYFFGSFLLRMSVTLAGFYGLAGGRWQSLMAALAGFLLTKVAFVTLQPSTAKGD